MKAPECNHANLFENLHWIVWMSFVFLDKLPWTQGDLKPAMWLCAVSTGGYQTQGFVYDSQTFYWLSYISCLRAFICTDSDCAKRNLNESSWSRVALGIVFPGLASNARVIIWI